MNSQKYWKKREREWQNEQIKDDKVRMAEIKKKMQYAQDEIQKEIEANWTRFSAGQNISVSEAIKRADEMDVKAFARKAKKYVEEKNFSPEANRQLKLYNLTMRVNRLELLKAQIGLELASAFDDINDYVKDELTKAYIEERKRQAGILGESVSDKDYSKQVKAVLNSSHKSSSVNFSRHIWLYEAELKADLDKLLIKSITQGKNPKILVTELSKLMTDDGKENAKFNIQRLLVSETTRVQIEAQKQSYNDNDIEEYGYMSEPNACNICLPLNDKIFKLKDMMPGTNAPGMHPFCRCSTYPYMDRAKWEQSMRDRGLYTKAEEEELKVQQNSKNETFKEFDEKLEKELQDASDKWNDNLNGDESNSIENYTDTWFNDYNGLLMDSSYNSVDNEWIYENIQHLDNALDKFYLNNDIITYRGISLKEKESILNGNHFKEYKSTTGDRHIAENFAEKNEGTIVKFKIPKGSNGGYFGKNSSSSNEKEFLVGRGSTYDVKETPEGLEVTINGNKKEKLPTNDWEDDDDD